LDDGSAREADEVLFATGRELNTGDIGLDTVGLTPDPGWASTNPAGCVASTNIFGEHCR
jgi:dihydrolipoamide dehydrogenase